jgi:glycosyltransferase involved in cell wall biosynthesis
MRIIVDLRSVHPGLTGIGRYAQNLALSLETLDGHISLLGITSESGMEFLRGTIQSPLIPVPTLDRRWDEVGLPELLRREKADVYHTPLFVLPCIRTCISITTIHDVIPLSRPDLSAPGFTTFFHANLKNALRRATHLVTVSEFSRKDCLKHCDIPPDRITAVQEPVSPHFGPRKPEESARILEGWGLTAGFILSVGALDRRKNIGGLLEAYRLLREEVPEAPLLAIVGASSGDAFDLDLEVGKRGLTEHVRALGRVSDEVLAHLYSAAEAFAFPSLYEGFGLPVLEAMASGTPVIASASTSLPEVVGDAAILVDPENPREIKDALARILKDSALRASLVKKGFARASQFSLKRHGEHLYDLYSRLAGVTV